MEPDWQESTGSWTQSPGHRQGIAARQSNGLNGPSSDPSNAPQVALRVVPLSIGQIAAATRFTSW